MYSVCNPLCIGDVYSWIWGKNGTRKSGNWVDGITAPYLRVYYIGNTCVVFQFVRSEISTAVTMKNIVFWDSMP
jgi:hypothetical protein